MTWTEKDKATPFDNQSIEGLSYLDGDLVALLLKGHWTVGQKYPLITFPSGIERSLWEISNPERIGIVHLFGELDLPLKSTREEAYIQATDIAEQCGYRAKLVGNDQLEVVGHDTDEHLLLTYDDDNCLLVNVEEIKTPEPVGPVQMELLPDDIRQQLPELYTNEELGLDAPAVVKFFTPDAGWTWYASEFDGNDLFFGLVSGLEVELGYFSLSELREVRGPWGLPIERDLYFKPQSLSDLKARHERPPDH
ncbi:DUF2958 domain-containing protein [Chloroflexota bacterium]